MTVSDQAASVQTRRSVTDQGQTVGAPSCLEAVLRLGSVALRSAGEVKFLTGVSLFLPLRSVTGVMLEHFINPEHGFLAVA